MYSNCPVITALFKKKCNLGHLGAPITESQQILQTMSQALALVLKVPCTVNSEWPGGRWSGKLPTSWNEKHRETNGFHKPLIRESFQD